MPKKSVGNSVKSQNPKHLTFEDRKQSKSETSFENPTFEDRILHREVPQKLSEADHEAQKISTTPGRPNSPASHPGKRTHAVSQRSRTPTGAAHLTSTPYSPLDTRSRLQPRLEEVKKPGQCMPASPRVRESRYPPSPHPRGPKRSRTPTGSPHRRSRNRIKVTTVHALPPLDTKAWQMSASNATEVQHTLGVRNKTEVHAIPCLWTRSSLQPRLEEE